MVAICSCASAFLRVALLLLEDCLELQSELAVSILPMAGNLPPCEDSAIRLGVKKRAVSKMKDRNAEGFWCSSDDISAVCHLNAENPKWGKRNIGAHLQGEQSRNIPISTIRRYYDTFLFGIEESWLFLFIGLLPLTRFWTFGLYIGSCVDFGHYIGLLDIIWHVLDLWTSCREACGLWTLHRDFGHYIGFLDLWTSYRVLDTI